MAEERVSEGVREAIDRIVAESGVHHGELDISIKIVDDRWEIASLGTVKRVLNKTSKGNRIKTK